MSKKKKYNYPKSLPILKFFWNAQAIRRNPIPFHREYFTAYGDTFSVRLGRTKYLMLSRDKDVVQHILQKNHKNYYKSRIQTDYLSKYLGNGLLTTNGDFWLKQRRLIQPAFHKQKLQQLMRVMESTIESELQSLPTDETISVFPRMNHLAFKIVANSLFDVSIPEPTLQRLQTIIEKIQLFLVKEVRLPHLGFWFRATGQVADHQKLAQETRDIIRNIIEERKTSGEQYDDLLDMLLATRYEDTGEPMSTEQLIDEISILFVAGHETTANALTFTVHLLANHPEKIQAIQEEIAAAEEETDDLFDRLGKMPYTKACIEESMRLYPPAWITDRENLEDDTIKDYVVKKNTLIGVSFYELHRHPDYWDNPDAFVPERFMGDARKKTAGVYYPFGAGPRMCIGMGFAVYEMVLAISYIVKRFTLTTQKKDLTLNPLITLKPIGVEVIFERK